MNLQNITAESAYSCLIDGSTFISKEEFAKNWSFCEKESQFFNFNNEQQLYNTFAIGSNNDIAYLLQREKQLLPHLFSVLVSPQGIKKFKEMYLLLEKFCILLLGHYSEFVRDNSVKLLTSLYDGHDWQITTPLETHFIRAGDIPNISFNGNKDVSHYVIYVSTLCYNEIRHFHLQPIDEHSIFIPIITKYNVIQKQNENNELIYTCEKKFGALESNGYFDYKIIDIDNNTIVKQSRYIVFPKGINEEVLHEVLIDLEGIQVDKEANKIIRTGDFNTVCQKIDHYKELGITTLYLMGALQRLGDHILQKPLSRRNSRSSSMDSDLEGLNIDPIGIEKSEKYDKPSQFGNDFSVVNNQENKNTISTSPYDYINTDKIVHSSDSREQLPNHNNNNNNNNNNKDSSIIKKSLSFSDTIFLLSKHEETQFPSQSTTNKDDSGNSISSHRSRSNSEDFQVNKYESESSATAVLDRSTIDKEMGGEDIFEQLIRKAESRHIRIMLQMEASVHSTQSHRRYRRDWSVHYRTIEGSVCCHEGTDGKENQWSDQKLLNYRLVDVWNILLDDILTLSNDHNIRGLFLRDGQSWPLIMKLDTHEMLRKDIDGEYHYSCKDILEGYCVQHDQEGGYFASPASAKYPSPLLYKISHILYQRFPNYLLVSSSFWSRAPMCLVSGVIPYDDSLIQSLYWSMGLKIEKNGNIRLLTDKEKPIDLLKKCFATNNTGSLLNSPSFKAESQQYIFNYICSECSPYPSLLLKRAAWTAIDLLFTLPGLQSTYIGEQEGNGYKIQVGNIYICDEKQLEIINYAEEKEPYIYDDTLPSKQKYTFQFQTDDKYHVVYIMGSFNNWNKSIDKMEQKEHLRDQYLYSFSISLDPGLYTYKFYIPEYDLYLYDKTSPVMDDNMGGFNNFTNIPIPTQHMSLKRHPRDIANGFWDDVYIKSNDDAPHESVTAPTILEDIPENDEIEHPTINIWVSPFVKRRNSLSGQSHVSSSTSSSSLTPDLYVNHTPSTSPTPFGYINENIGSLPKLQNDLIQSLGPEYGFDLGYIAYHYKHRQSIRKQYDVLKRGFLQFLDVSSPSKVPHAVSFFRYLPHQLFFVLSSLEQTPLKMTVNFKSMVNILHNMNIDEEKDINKITSLWKITNVVSNLVVGYITTKEFLSRDADHMMQPWSSVFYLYDYIPSPPITLIHNYLYDSLISVKTLLEQTAANGHRYHNAKDIINRELPSDQYILSHLRRCHIFEVILSYVEKIVTVGYHELKELLNYLYSIIKSQGKEPFESFSKCIYQTLYFSRYVYNYDVDLLINEFDLLINDKTLSIDIMDCVISMKKMCDLGPIVFITPELGKWSTVGGLGAIVDILTRAIARQNQDVYVISPYYDTDRKGNHDYLKGDQILYVRNIDVPLGRDEHIKVGIHEGRLENVHFFFFHYAECFMRPYPGGDPAFMMRFQKVISLISLEIILQFNVKPAVIVSNDWPTALIPAYGRLFYPKTPLADASFFHIFHNLDVNYEGRIYPNDAQGDLYWIHQLEPLLLIDPYWKNKCVNPSRCVLLTTDNWATVSNVYKDEIIHSSPLEPLLTKYPNPFATPNGIASYSRLLKYGMLSTNTHETAKQYVQEKYFHNVNASIPLFVFVGRITEQKGVHLIATMAKELIQTTNRNIQIIVGGMASPNDPYGNYCVFLMKELVKDYPDCFWADPSQFFTDGFICNLAGDFGLMPSLFEPSGLVQHEFFAAKTPVIAFKTGGLAETVFEWDSEKETGNGFLFQQYNETDFRTALYRAVQVYKDTDKYNKLRESAGKTCIDISQQARDYICEFSRIRRVLIGSPITSFTYMPNVNDTLPSEVYIAGDFTDWSEHKIKMIYNKQRNIFEAYIKLQPGNYLYKFLVDNEWKCSWDQDIYVDSHGSKSHYCTGSTNRNILLDRLFQGSTIQDQ
ncbi:hypothetical protein WA158_001385 [Blastocystis sp. Blastoise]